MREIWSVIADWLAVGRAYIETRNLFVWLRHTIECSNGIVARSYDLVAPLQRVVQLVAQCTLLPHR